VPGQTVINKIPSPGDAGNLLVTTLTGRVEVGPRLPLSNDHTAGRMEGRRRQAHHAAGGGGRRASSGGRSRVMRGHSPASRSR
jgi:hypothetical protein